MKSRASGKDNDICSGFGVQEWDDGSIYEGEFMNGLKHGKGKYTWKTGEYYEGFFNKDCCHGEGFYCWPSGHKFTGEFYLSRKEGYGHHLFPDGTSFQGLYHLDHRFGPGVMTYPNGCVDVGFWVGKHLHKLCDAAEESFSLEDFPEYAAYVEPRAPVQLLDDALLPSGTERRSADDCSLLLTGQTGGGSFGELWEADHHRGERHPASSLSLQARVETHVHKHRRAAENLSWDVAAVLALNRDHFGPKGPLEIMSEQLIQRASRGEVQAVSKIIQTGLVHPDVADSRGNTALIVATVNYHHDVLHLLLDVGADVDKLNTEGMSPLAVCHLLYYPFRSLPAVFTAPLAKSKILESLLTQDGGNPDLRQADVSKRDPALSSQSGLSEQTSGGIAAQPFDDGSKKPSDTKQLQEEENDLKGKESRSAQKLGWAKGANKRELANRSDQACEFRETEVGQEVDPREVYLNTLELLLERGADPNTSRVPVPVLFSAILACDREGIRRLLLWGARTDIPLPPERRGLYPLHVAAALPGPAGPEVTEMLLHTLQDPDARAHDHDDIFELDKAFIKAQQRTNESAHIKEGGRTALHVACQRESDHQNATKVVALLLSHGASTDLLWSGHSPLSLAIATGNVLAVEELLNGGANPNIPLGPNVGSALCAFANIHYTLDDRKEKLLQMLVQAGADILMPVMVDGDVGTAMDYAYYSFHQDLRISGTPFNALNAQEQEIFKARCRLLCMMGDLMRQAAHQRELEVFTEKEQQTDASPQQRPHSSRKPVPKFCYYCGRSVSVRLTPCYRCYKVFYCSRPCRLKAWDQLHKNECVRVKAGTHGFDRTCYQDGQEPSTGSNIAEEMWRFRCNPRENYTFN